MTRPIVPRSTVVAVVCLVTIPTLIALYLMALNLRNDQVQSCERGNITRVALHSFMIDAAKVRERAAREGGGQPDWAAARRYRKRARALVGASAPVADEIGTVRVDCEEAYPRPWPGWPG